MNAGRQVCVALVTLGLVACGKAGPPGQGAADLASTPPDQEPPVALNGDSPIQYPPRQYEQKVEGDVVLRLYVDSTGRLAAESSRVAESSGYPALDSAAVSGARRLRFAPARRHGLPIATAFLQPIEFRHPQASTAVRKGEPDTVSVAPSPPRAARRPAPAPAAAPSATSPTLPTQPATTPLATPPSARPQRRDSVPSRPQRRDTVPARPDTLGPRPDTTRATPDKPRAKPDTNATPH